MPIGATIVGISTVGSALVGSSAASSAAKTQANAANQATAVQQQMFNQTRSDLQPFTSYGTGAVPALNKLLGIGGAAAPTVGAPNWDAYMAANPDVAARAQQGVTSGEIGAGKQWGTPQDWAAFHYQNGGKAEGRVLPTFTNADVSSAGNGVQTALEAIPGYQFMRDQGVASINRSLGSFGQTGAQAKGIARFVTGLADQTYGEQVGRLQSAASLGESAAAGTGQIGQGYASNIGNNIVGAGTASAAGTVGAANAVTGALGQIPSYLMANKFLSGGGGAGMYGSASAFLPGAGNIFTGG